MITIIVPSVTDSSKNLIGHLEKKDLPWKCTYSYLFYLVMGHDEDPKAYSIWVNQSKVRADELVQDGDRILIDGPYLVEGYI